MTEVLPGEEVKQDRVECILRGFQVYPFHDIFLQILDYIYRDPHMVLVLCTPLEIIYL